MRSESALGPPVVSGVARLRTYSFFLVLVLTGFLVTAIDQMPAKSDGATGAIKTTDFGTVAISGGAFCWRGYAVKMAQDTIVTGMIGGGIKPYVVDGDEFRGAILDATMDGDLPSKPKDLLVEVRFEGKTVNQIVGFADKPDQVLQQGGFDEGADVLTLHKGEWYYLFQGSFKGSVLHYYVDSLRADDLIEASTRVEDWLPGADAQKGTAFIGPCDGPAGALEGRTLSSTPAKPALGIVYSTDVTALPEVSTSSEALQAVLTNSGGGSTALYMEFGTAIANDPDRGPECDRTNPNSDGEFPGCRITTGLELNLAEAAYTGEVPYSYGATLSGLSVQTKYFYRARAINDVGRVDGAIRSFTTAARPGKPIVDNVSGLDGGLALTISPAPVVNTGGAGDLVGLTTNYQYRLQLKVSEEELPTGDWTEWISAVPANAQNPMRVTRLGASGPPVSLQNDVEYWVQVRALSSGVLPEDASFSDPVLGTPTLVVEPEITPPPATPAATPSAAPAVTPPQAAVVPERVLPRTPVVPAPTVGPVARANPGAPAPTQPTATVGGQVTVLQTQVAGSNSVSVRSGSFTIGLTVQPAQGSIRQDSGGSSAELEVRSGGSTAFSGSGVMPGSTVQVFIPRAGGDSREVGRMDVDATGSFSGDALFGVRPGERPMPIGRQVMQIVSVDASGRQAVVEMAVNIAQPAPAPEMDRALGQAPELRPGQLVATNAGDSELVTVTPQPDQKQATIQGNSWSMSFSIPGDGGSVAESDDGEVMVEFIRNQTAAVAGSGFMPGTRADVWLFSDPTLLGSVTIDDNGEFSGEVNVDGNVVTVGEHTLQLQGVGDDGFVRSANLGVVVNDEAPLVATEDAATSFLWAFWLAGGLAAVAATGLGWQLRRRVR